MTDQTKHEEITNPVPSKPETRDEPKVESKPETRDEPKVESKPAWEPGYYVGDYPPVYK